MYDVNIVTNIIEKAFHYTCRNDYAHGYAIFEADIRNSIYFHVRRALDYDERWRIFSDLSKKIDGKKIYKPDFVLFKSEDNHKTEKIEIVVELKHWPNIGKIEHDLNKLRDFKIITNVQIIKFTLLNVNLQKHIQHKSMAALRKNTLNCLTFGMIFQI